MNEGVVNRPREAVPRLWPKWADRASVASFYVLLPATLLSTSVSFLRGPGPVPFPTPAQAAAKFAAAGMDPMMVPWLRLATGCLASFVLAGVATLLYRQRRRQSVAALLSISLLLLSSWYYGLRFLKLPQAELWGAPLASAGWALFTLAVMLFPDGRFWSPRMRWPALALVALPPLALLPAFAAISAAVGGSFLVLAVAGLLFRYRRLEPGEERQQVRWALFGFAAGAALTIPAFVFEPILIRAEAPPDVWAWGLVGYNFLMPGAHTLIAAGLLVSMLRYRLYDADKVITRSVSYGVLTVTLLALFAGTEKVVELLGEKWFHEELGVLAGGLGAAFAAAMFVPLHHRLSHWAEHKFQKQLIRLRTGLPLLVGDMRESAPVARIAAATLDSIVHGVLASRVALLFDGALVDARGIEADEVERWKDGWIPQSQEGFDIDRTDPLFPLRIPLEADGHGRVGWLLLGPRPDGSFYGRDERETLAAVADPVARALERAASREAREEAERGQWQDQKTLNARLLTTLSAIDGKLDRLFEPPGLAAE
jgi:hypothetical protein